MYYKINNEYYLDKNDVGKLITIKNNNFTSAYHSMTNKYENCLLISLIHSANDKIRPSAINLLNQNGNIIKVSFYEPNQIEVKFL